MTLDQHPNDKIQIISPGGYVTISPKRLLTGLFAHAGVRGTEIPIILKELKEQVVENCNYNESEGTWYLLTDVLYQDSQVQAPEMNM